MSKISNPKQLLNDLARELDGETLEDIFELAGKKWTIRLLNEEESNWRNGFVNTGSKLAALTSWRLPTLAIGIRAIDGVPIYQFFQEEWNATAEGREALALIDGGGRFSQKYHAAEHFMEWLAERFPEKMEDFWEYWQKLENRRTESQESVKKSSGESSETNTEPNGTELSPSGDE